jgi:hypothetical protein
MFELSDMIETFAAQVSQPQPQLVWEQRVTASKLEVEVVVVPKVEVWEALAWGSCSYKNFAVPVVGCTHFVVPVAGCTHFVMVSVVVGSIQGYRKEEYKDPNLRSKQFR